MPGPGSAGKRLLERHLGVVKIDFAAKDLLHGAHHAWQSADQAKQIIACLIPDLQSRNASLAVATTERVFLNACFGGQTAKEQFAFLAIKQMPQENEASPLEICDLVAG